MKQDLQLIVDQSVVGHFYWTIVRFGEPGELPCVMDYARGPLPSHSAALIAGQAALVEQLGQSASCEIQPGTEPMPATESGAALDALH